ncbi:YggT family protein [Legionella fairfieldensis]|uniref:YggT family protein n=1 Tax=Legionella fairfieldensis TaxID=45064 RepID=UPI00048A4A78|nr:YggT family protein [Legionella fairfieldensis]
MSGLLAVSYFLSTLFFSVVLFVLWTRLALRYFKISVLHPVSHAIYTFTDPLVKPLERFISPQKKLSQCYDWPCFALLILVELCKFVLLGFLLYGTLIPVSYLLLFVLADLITQPCNFLFYLILIRVIMSWVNPHWHHPVADVIKIITDPLLILGRRLIPDISGFDFSPFIVMVVLKAIALFMSASLPLRLV